MKLEKWAQGLTVVSFVLMCWVVHRSVQARTDCVNSAAINLVLVDGVKVYNCRYESRLSLHSLLHPLPYSTRQTLRQLESAEVVNALVPVRHPSLVVEIVDSAADFFEMGRGYVRLGKSWLTDHEQLSRALTMGALNSIQEDTYADSFQLEVISDFVRLAAQGGIPSGALSQLKFSNTASDFASYCKAPLRSLTHARACASSEGESADLHLRIAGFRPLLASALWRVFDRSSLSARLEALRRLREGPRFPVIIHPIAGDSATLAVWFTELLREQLTALGLEKEIPALKRSLKELEVESPTHWELTVDVTKTPAWKEILEQLRTRSFFRPKERTLVFTPEGAVALPSGLPVEWAAADISSQKHVLIACSMPEADAAVAIQARHFYSQKSCAKLSKAFWD